MNLKQVTRESIPGRLHKRVTYPFDLRVEYEGQGTPLSVFGPAISIRGMFVNVRQFIPNSTILKVCFRLPSTNFQVTARCEVRCCLPGLGVGVEFIDLSPKARRAIQSEVKRAEVSSNRRNNRARRAFKEEASR